MKSYHLKWSSHLANMGLVFSTLYQSEGLSDVTLFCEDGNIRAHKLLLSTCSDFFLVRLSDNSLSIIVIIQLQSIPSAHMTPVCRVTCNEYFISTLYPTKCEVTGAAVTEDVSLTVHWDGSRAPQRLPTC